MFYLKRQIVILLTKRIRLNFLSKLLDLKSDYTLTLGYLNPALNNPALDLGLLMHSQDFALFMFRFCLFFSAGAEPQTEANFGGGERA